MTQIARMGPTNATLFRRMNMRTKLLLIATTAGLSLPNFGFAQDVNTSTASTINIPKNNAVFNSTKLTIPKIETSTTLQMNPKTNSTETTLKLPRDINGLKGGGIIDGGGGDELGMMVQADAVAAVSRLGKVVDAETFAKLKNVLNETKFVVVNDELVVTDASGKKQFSAAQNFPSTHTIYVQRQRVNQMKDVVSRQRLMGHEILSLAGLESTGDYHLSSKISPSATAETSNSKGTILYNEFYNSDPKGYTADSAADICQAKKDEFADQYYYVYCSYWRKPIKEGFSCNTDNSHSCGDDIEYVYGLRVYGLGKDSELVWKTVFSSKAFGPDKNLNDEYDNNEDAQSACVMNMIQNSEAKWTKPRCLVKQDGAQFYYEIQTQNPLAHGQK